MKLFQAHLLKASKFTPPTNVRGKTGFVIGPWEGESKNWVIEMFGKKVLVERVFFIGSPRGSTRAALGVRLRPFGMASEFECSVVFDAPEDQEGLRVNLEDYFRFLVGYSNEWISAPAEEAWLKALALSPQWVRDQLLYDLTLGRFSSEDPDPRILGVLEDASVLRFLHDPKDPEDV